MIDRSRATITLTLEEFDNIQNLIRFLKLYNYNFISEDLVEFKTKWESESLFDNLKTLCNFLNESEFIGWVIWKNKMYWFNGEVIDFSKTKKYEE